MNLLVTGGAGFIGSHLCEELLKLGHVVTALDNFSNGNQENVAHLLEHPSFRLVKGDCNHVPTVDPLIKEHDVVFHLAAVLGVKHCVESPLHVIKENLSGTSTILESAARFNKRVIFASSSEVYGKSENLPYKEDGDRLLGSTHVHRWCYSTAKSMEEHLCLAYGKEGLPVTILRYFNAYGPRANDSIYGGVVPIFVRAAIENKEITLFGDGTQSRCFTFVKDTVKATAMVLQKKTDQEIINIGTNQVTTISELATIVKSCTQSSSPIKHISYEEAYGKGFEDMKKRIPCTEKAKSLLDYVPETNLIDGIQSLVNSYQKTSLS